MIGKIFTLVLLIGWSLGAFVTTEEKFNESFKNLIAEFEEREPTKTENWDLGVSIDFMFKGFGLAAIGFLAMGVFVYQIFPIPPELITPILLFLVLDLFLFGLLSYFLFNFLFAGLLLLLEKTGLVNWGGKI